MVRSARTYLPDVRLRAVAALGVIVGAGPTMSACSESVGHHVVDAVVSTAYRPQLPAAPPHPPYRLLAGDLHCHVTPPDFPPHVVRGLAETASLAEREGLDFVVLTPHVGARFFEDEALRRRVLADQTQLARDAASLPAGRTAFIAGFEYTDGAYGHVGAAFGDLSAVLEGLPAAEARAHPEAFFERYVASGGLLVVNHPFTTPTNAVVSISRADLSWRPFTGRGPFPPEIAAVQRLAQGYEAFNLTTAELRDRYLYLDRARSVRETLARVDEEILDQRRPLFPVGGSDSHSHSLRATTFVLSTGRSAGEIREALLAGRTCIRAPVACSLEARTDLAVQRGPGPTDDGWSPVGARLRGARVELRTQGKHFDVLRNGEPAGEAEGGQRVRVDTPPGECSVLRAAIDEGWSAPIYVNCPFGSER
jgi:hypothetical protein